MSLLLTAILIALSEIESGNNDLAIGKHGERSRYQITEDAWNEKTHLDFKRYSRRKSESELVARTIVESNALRFKWATGRAPSLKDVYAMWNMGFTGYQKRRFDFEKLPKSVRDRCERFENLVNGFYGK